MVHGGPPRVIASTGADRHRSAAVSGTVDRDRYYRSSSPVKQVPVARTSSQRDPISSSPTRRRPTSNFSPTQRRSVEQSSTIAQTETRGHSTSRERSTQNVAQTETRGHSTSRERSTQNISSTRDPPPRDHLDEAGESLCDYDTSATMLYELLESSCWEKARSRCRSHPTEVRTWIVRKDKSLRVRWKLLPLHAAIIFQSPNFVVSALLERYPGAASRKDDQGMLPLHLAFRHKQEDEDLLELLLVQYPKAVMIKDRRDRVPLEHGRECKFSAKLMRLYADATVAGSRAMAKCEDSRTTQTSLITSVSGSQRARMEAENEARLDVLRVEHENEIKHLRDAHHNELKTMGEEHQGEIKALKTVSEDRIQILREHHTVALRQLKHGADNEKRTLVDQHNEEIEEFKELLSREAGKDREDMVSMEQEVVRLRVEMEDVGMESERIAAQYERLQTHTDELKEVLESITNDQSSIEEMAAQQQDELDLARTMRKQLVQTLMQQEDDEGQNDRLRGTKIVELAQLTRDSIAKVLENNALVESHLMDLQMMESHQVGSQQVEADPVEAHREVSRVEVERENDEDEGRFSAAAAIEVTAGEGADVFIAGDDDRFATRAREEFYGIEKQSRSDYIKSQKESTDEYYGDIAILGDEISAITELSEHM
jgi:hypothetical protein